jgi:RNA polymerase sigma factor (sigma-70 family)
VTTRRNGRFERQLQTVFNLGAIGDLTDGQLLERFATRGGEAAELAFAALVERHGPMVLRVCRHALGEAHDAEDSFQATFLILVKQARSLWVQDSLGPWLHRVAHRVATRARVAAARVRGHERRAAAARSSLLQECRDWEEIVEHLHAEIDRLPERYRVPVVLCDLEGLTHEQAARHLGWPVGTLKTRLARARDLLRGRLSRRGLDLPAVLCAAEKRLAVVLPLRARGAALPGVLVESTVRAAGPVAAGKALSTSVISSRVAVLIEEVLKTMVVTKLKLASVVVLVGALGAAGAGVLAQQGPRGNPGQGVDQRQPAADQVGARRAAAGEAAQAGSTTPAYIRQSRGLILTRLEEEVAEARARLDRTLRRFQSPEHPAVVRAQETLDALAQRLDRIDRVLVDVVETYPTMVDFSGGPGEGDPNAPAAGAKRQGQMMQDQPAPQGQRSGGEGADSRKNPGQQGQNRHDQSPEGGADALRNQMAPDRRIHGHGAGKVIADLDNDGVLDVYIANDGHNANPGQKSKSDRNEGRAQKNREQPAQGSQSKRGVANKDTANPSSSEQPSQRGDASKQDVNPDSNQQSQRGKAPKDDGANRSSDQQSEQEQQGADARPAYRSNGAKSEQAGLDDPGER